MSLGGFKVNLGYGIVGTCAGRLLIGSGLSAWTGLFRRTAQLALGVSGFSLPNPASASGFPRFPTRSTCCSQAVKARPCPLQVSLVAFLQATSPTTSDH